MTLGQRLAALSNRFYDRMRHRDAYTAARGPATAEGFGALRGHKYCLLVTYKRSGEPVPTPVLVLVSFLMVAMGLPHAHQLDLLFTPMEVVAVVLSVAIVVIVNMNGQTNWFEGILLLARTDARVSRGFDEALARIRAFVAEGADILFLDSPQSEEEMRTGIEACDGKPALAVTSPAGKHFMPGDAELEHIGIRIVVYPQDILAASVRAMRDALAGLKGGSKPPMASPAELATAIRIAEYLSQDSRWPDPS